MDAHICHIIIVYIIYIICVSCNCISGTHLRDPAWDEELPILWWQFANEGVHLGPLSFSQHIRSMQTLAFLQWSLDAHGCALYDVFLKVHWLRIIVELNNWIEGFVSRVSNFNPNATVDLWCDQTRAVAAPSIPFLWIINPFHQHTKPLQKQLCSMI